ncbi:MAG: serine hydrolase [Gammaproteobacteria bacterium]|nr:serine hydrolase [Gammaproteobacteria bacterium]
MRIPVLKPLLILTLVGLIGWQFFSLNKSASIDRFVSEVMKEYQVPGISVGIMENGQIIHQKSYGIANLKTQQPVDVNTIFKIASNSKAFTSAALAILVEQEKLSWDDKVVDYLPEFKTYDPWVTEQFNIRDLLTHRSGLRIGSGDMMIWPEPTKFTRDDVVKNFQYLKPVSSFRDEYAYDNLLYIVAGEIIAKVSGQPWEDFIQQNIFNPLEMNRCYAGGIDTTKEKNLAAPHVKINEEVIVDVPNLINERVSIMAAAGGIKCSVSDMLKWIQLQLNQGQMANGEFLFSQEQSQLMWTPVVTLPMYDSLREMDQTHYRGYALGWRISDYHGQWRISHTGTLSGMMSQVVLIPDMDLGVVILLNQSSGEARNVLMRGLLQHFITEDKTDWLAYYKQLRAEREAEALVSEDTDEDQEIVIRSEDLALTAIEINETNTNRLGTYIDPWFGQITLTQNENGIVFNSDKSPRMVGQVYYYAENQWWVKWDNRSFNADAWLLFEESEAGLQLKMEAIDEDADWSFSFDDLNFEKVEDLSIQE